jgi:hypothetical protein
VNNSVYVERDEALWMDCESQPPVEPEVEANKVGTRRMPVLVFGFEFFESVLGGSANIFVVVFGRSAECS